MKIIQLCVVGALIAILSGCTTTSAPSPKSQLTPLEIGKAVQIKDKVEEFTFAYRGNTYRLQTRRDTLLQARITVVNVEQGEVFTGKDDEDLLVQNVIRDAFRAEGICKDGKHPGLLNFGFLYDPREYYWVARVRCSDVLQKNVAI